jgi:ubiquinone/menaquinone biosynthesis C-methylase UbiE
LRKINQAVDSATERFKWKRGDLLLVDNVQVTHGRMPFRGKRRILVAMSQGGTWNETPRRISFHAFCWRQRARAFSIHMSRPLAGRNVRLPGRRLASLASDWHILLRNRLRRREDLRAKRRCVAEHSGASQKAAVEIQRAYYAQTAARYDDMHVREDDEHGFALRFLTSAVEQLGIRSILDVGCGTGRALIRIKEALPGIAAVGIEPSAELRAVGHAKGLSAIELIDGDAMKIAFDNGSFDLVCEFGVLHHVPEPSKAVAEMLRVTRKAIFISDSNNFGQGSSLSRLVKQTINGVGLWPVADFIKTRGKGYSFEDGDGLAYSYSVFNDYKQIAKACKSVHFLNTRDGGPNLYRTATHVALLGVKATSDGQTAVAPQNPGG